MRLRWTERTTRDLIEIGDDIAANAPAVARLWVDALRQRAAKALLFPRAGRVVPEFNREDVREVFERTYRIVYRVVGDGIVVLAVFEGHRLLDTLQPDDD